jgi:hypothetical protein
VGVVLDMAGEPELRPAAVFISIIEEKRSKEKHCHMEPKRLE